MTWLTWRQFRTQAITVYAGIVVLVVFLAATRGHLLRVTAGDPATALQDVTEAQGVLYLVGTVVVALLPAVIGTFWGAPLVTRELEAGTHHLVWNQSVTRTRWLAVKLGLIGATAIAAAALASLAFTTWVAPIDRLAALVGDSGLPARIGPWLFDARGIAPASHAAFAFVLGVTMGIIIRRTVPAMAVTLAIFIAVQIAVPLWVRPHIIPPTDQTVAVGEAGGAGWMTGNVFTFWSVAPGGAWLLTDETLDPSGRPIESVPPGVGTCAPAENVDGPVENDPMGSCLTSLGDLGYRQHVVYHAPDRFWALQWAETAMFLVLSLMLTAVCFHWTRHRLS